MANDLLTVSDVLSDALNLSDAEVTELEQGAPFVTMLPTEEASDGTVHRYVKEIGAPVVGFRTANNGRDLDKSEEEEIIATLEILDFSFQVDVAVADKRRGRKGGREAFLAKEGGRHRRAAMFAYEQQVIKGQIGANPTGFEGFADQASLATLAGGMVFDAGGTAVGAAGSVYAVRIGGDDVLGVYNGDEPVIHKDPVVQQVTGANGKPHAAYYTAGNSWLGLQVGAIKSVGRIANLDLAVTAGKYDNGVTDDMLAELITMFPSGRPPTHFVMPRFARLQLQRSRTATTVKGEPAPLPDEAHGITVMTTDALAFDEALLV